MQCQVKYQGLKELWPDFYVDMKVIVWSVRIFDYFWKFKRCKQPFRIDWNLVQLGHSAMCSTSNRISHVQLFSFCVRFCIKLAKSAKYNLRSISRKRSKWFWIWQPRHVCVIAEEQWSWCDTTFTFCKDLL